MAAAVTAAAAGGGGGVLLAIRVCPVVGCVWCDGMGVRLGVREEIAPFRFRAMPCLPGWLDSGGVQSSRRPTAPVKCRLHR
jgi:hypothetical protein